MRDLDDTDRELVRLLLEDARRSYRELAAAVDLSPPAVSDRIDRRREVGLIERFTVDLDRTRLREGRASRCRSTSPRGERRRQGGAGRRRGRRARLRHGRQPAHRRRLGPGRRRGGPPRAGVRDGRRRVRRRVAAGRRRLAPRTGRGDARPGVRRAREHGDRRGGRPDHDGERYEFCRASREGRFTDRYEEIKEGAEADEEDV